MILLCNMCEHMCKHGGKMKEICSNCGDGKNYKPLFAPVKPDSRPEMLSHAVPHYERSNSRIPEKIRVSFSDGSTAVYTLQTEQADTLITENIRIIRKWKQEYVNRPARRRRRK